MLIVAEAATSSADLQDQIDAMIAQRLAQRATQEHQAEMAQQQELA